MTPLMIDARGPATQLQPVRCIDCASPDVFAAFLRAPKDGNTTRAIAQPAFWSDAAYVILQCRQCGSFFLHPHYFPESFAVYTDPKYFTGYFPKNIHRGGGPEIEHAATGAFGRWRDRVRRSRSRAKARLLLRLAGIGDPRGARVMDVGCASGRLVQGFTELGCDAYGVDVSTFAVEAATRKRLQVSKALFQDYACPDEFFDLIVSIQTFEHMAGLEEVVGAIRRKLKPEGALIIETPNDIDGYRRWLFPKIWWMIPPMHIRYYTRASVTKIFGQRGMAVEAIRTTGSVGLDLAVVADWLLRKARFHHLPLYGKSMTIASAVVRLLTAPLDWLLVRLGRHSELLVVMRLRKECQVQPDPPKGDG